MPNAYRFYDLCYELHYILLRKAELEEDLRQERADRDELEAQWSDAKYGPLCNNPFNLLAIEIHSATEWIWETYDDIRDIKNEFDIYLRKVNRARAALRIWKMWTKNIAVAREMRAKRFNADFPPLPRRAAA
jgi:hypothetical protein